MSDLYRYDVGDESDPDSWGESPEAYMRRNWLEAHNYLVKVEPDYEAAAINLWYQDGNKDQFRDALPTTREFYLNRVYEIARFLLGGNDGD